MILDPDLEGQVSYTGLVFAPDGRRIYLSNVDGSIKVFKVDPDGTVEGSHTFILPLAGAPRRAEEIPAGLAVTPDGRRLFVCGNLSNRLLELERRRARSSGPSMSASLLSTSSSPPARPTSATGAAAARPRRSHRTGRPRHRGQGRPGQAHRQRGLRQRHRPRVGCEQVRDPRPAPRLGPGPFARRPLRRLRQRRLGQSQRHRHHDRQGRRNDLGQVQPGRPLRGLAQRPGFFRRRRYALRRQRHPERRRRDHVRPQETEIPAEGPYSRRMVPGSVGPGRPARGSSTSPTSRATPSRRRPTSRPGPPGSMLTSTAARFRSSPNRGRRTSGS